MSKEGEEAEGTMRMPGQPAAGRRGARTADRSGRPGVRAMPHRYRSSAAFARRSSGSTGLPDSRRCRTRCSVVVLVPPTPRQSARFFRIFGPFLLPSVRVVSFRFTRATTVVATAAHPEINLSARGHELSSDRSRVGDRSIFLFLRHHAPTQ